VNTAHLEMTADISGVPGSQLALFAYYVDAWAPASRSSTRALFPTSTAFRAVQPLNPAGPDVLLTVLRFNFASPKETRAHRRADACRARNGAVGSPAASRRSVSTSITRRDTDGAATRSWPPRCSGANVEADRECGLCAGDVWNPVRLA